MNAGADLNSPAFQFSNVMVRIASFATSAYIRTSYVFILLMGIPFSLFAQSFTEPLRWREGYLDIHHINTARGNATFFIFPDGTTMLFDAGAKKIPKDKLEEYFSPPCDTLEAGAWIARYIKLMMPPGKSPALDYAVLSHFHNDHYGEIDSVSVRSKGADYFLSGITEVGDILLIKTLIDRGYSNFDDPVDARSFYRNDPTFQNYLKFLASQRSNNGLHADRLQAGRKDQIVLQNHPERYTNFHIRNIKANAIIWNGKGDSVTVHSLPQYALDEFDENALSLALKVVYGSFDYYTGGDLNGYSKWGGVDMETPIAHVVGEVDAMALNHHGYYDATNSLFLQTLSPKVIMHQVIHDPHFQPDVLERVAQHDADLFTYNMHESIRKKLPQKILNRYKSTQGHVVIRVLPSGHAYEVIILNDRGTSMQPVAKFGPYNSK